MLKNDASAASAAAAAAAAAASGPAKPKDGKAAALSALSAARATATSPSSNATNLRFGDRLVQAAQQAQQQHQLQHHHHVHEESLPLGAATAAATAGGGGIERPAAVLLAEGPDFRFEAISQCELPTDRGLFHLRAYRYTTTAATVSLFVFGLAVCVIYLFIGYYFIRWVRTK